jgi:hypothetical protein
VEEGEGKTKGREERSGYGHGKGVVWVLHMVWMVWVWIWVMNRGGWMGWDGDTSYNERASEGKGRGKHDQTDTPGQLGRRSRQGTGDIEMDTYQDSKPRAHNGDVPTYKYQTHNYGTRDLTWLPTYLPTYYKMPCRALIRAAHATKTDERVKQMFDEVGSERQDGFARTTLWEEKRGGKCAHMSEERRGCLFLVPT